ncbi:MAG: carboxypeptidase regulatory-like domain-containing protein [Methylococcaceae bacterium]|nr:carboxypeptidase regulatory-like domain-containing protein [Methylococcaceae bacterium]
MKPSRLFAILASLQLSLPAAARALEPQTQDEVRFVSGGIGAEENQALQAVRSDYNLHLLFSVQGSGEFLSDVALRITDRDGKRVLETVAGGPRLFAKLQPGRYTLEASHGSKTLRETVSIAGHHGASLTLAWPESPEN